MSAPSPGLAPVAEGLWTDEAEPRLIGGRHRASGEIVFPMPAGDAAHSYDAVPLSRTGTLWSWTSQDFRPKSPPYAGPEAFTPYLVGYVELPGQVIVETRIDRRGTGRSVAGAGDGAGDRRVCTGAVHLCVQADLLMTHTPSFRLSRAKSRDVCATLAHTSLDFARDKREWAASWKSQT